MLMRPVIHSSLDVTVKLYAGYMWRFYPTSPALGALSVDLGPVAWSPYLWNTYFLQLAASKELENVRYLIETPRNY
jgi:hypothetical protein